MEVPHRIEAGSLYPPGAVIGARYEIRGILGQGGFGIVYLALDRHDQSPCALKTFRHELMTNLRARDDFKREALVWLNLGYHPFILTARWVQEFSGRLFVQMEYVPPDDRGRVHLGHYLTGCPLAPTQILEWSIQFCSAMEHAASHGIECHRDIKPGNILIGRDRAIRVCDFGLAAAAEAAWRQLNGNRETLLNIHSNSEFTLSLIQSRENNLCGTPGYIPPEVLGGKTWDVRGDIYGFGLVMWQMCTGSTSPSFLVPWNGNIEEFLRGNHEQQLACRLPGIDSPLNAVLKRCLSPERSLRYPDFQNLRRALESLWQERTGRRFKQAQSAAEACDRSLSQGASLAALGRHQEAIACYDRALALDDRAPEAWNNKGNALRILGRYEEALECLGKAVEIDSQNETLWTNHGNVLQDLGRQTEAIECYDKAIALSSGNPSPYYNKGMAFSCLKRHSEAIACFDAASLLDPFDGDIFHSKGVALAALDRHEEAVELFDKALALDPVFASAWFNKALSKATISLTSDDPLQDQREAKVCFLKSIALAQAENTNLVAKAQKGIQALESNNLYMMMRGYRPL